MCVCVCMFVCVCVQNMNRKVAESLVRGPEDPRAVEVSTVLVIMQHESITV